MSEERRKPSVERRVSGPRRVVRVSKDAGPEHRVAFVIRRLKADRRNGPWGLLAKLARQRHGTEPQQ